MPNFTTNELDDFKRLKNIILNDGSDWNGDDEPRHDKYRYDTVKFWHEAPKGTSETQRLQINDDDCNLDLWKPLPRFAKNYNPIVFGTSLLQYNGPLNNVLYKLFTEKSITKIVFTTSSGKIDTFDFSALTYLTDLKLVAINKKTNASINIDFFDLCKLQLFFDTFGPFMIGTDSGDPNGHPGDEHYTTMKFSFNNLTDPDAPTRNVRIGIKVKDRLDIVFHINRINNQTNETTKLKYHYSASVFDFKDKPPEVEYVSDDLGTLTMPPGYVLDLQQAIQKDAKLGRIRADTPEWQARRNEVAREFTINYMYDHMSEILDIPNNSLSARSLADKFSYNFTINDYIKDSTTSIDNKIVETANTLQNLINKIHGTANFKCKDGCPCPQGYRYEVDNIDYKYDCYIDYINLTYAVIVGGKPINRTLRIYFEPNENATDPGFTDSYNRLMMLPYTLKGRDANSANTYARPIRSGRSISPAFYVPNAPGAITSVMPNNESAPDLILDDMALMKEVIIQSNDKPPRSEKGWACWYNGGENYNHAPGFVVSGNGDLIPASGNVYNINQVIDLGQINSATNVGGIAPSKYLYPVILFDEQAEADGLEESINKKFILQALDNPF